MRLQLLGGAGIETEAGRVAFLPDKRFRLLAYLAYAGDWVDRERLGFLFWPDVETEQARHNLRQLLRRVQDLGWAAGLETERQRLRWPVETDVQDFLRALEAGATSEAVALYGGPLMGRLEGEQGGEFGEWLALERERLHGLWRGAVFELSRSGADALPALRALLAHDPLDEEALQTLMTHSARLGQPEVALGAYRAFEKYLRNEVRLVPSAATLHLAEAIAAGRDESLTAWSRTLVQAQTPLALPMPGTSFVGRDLELNDLLALLAKPHCRLLSITGPGGVGKTQLALKAAQEASYPDGVYFAALEALSTDTALSACVAAALGLELDAHRGAESQLVQHLSDKASLLVLDNCEHLPGVAPLVARLLAECPRLSVLATSREALHLMGEQRFPLEGLSYPAHPVPWQDALAYDAVQLFCERARRVLPSFALTEANAAAVQRICALVEGMPLALELAAAWVRAVPLADIAEEIAHNFDFLTSDDRDSRARHRSLRATFEHSWHLLTDAEQDALRRLSAFRGGFTLGAAKVVAGTPTVVLAALVDKSLLRLSPSGRYDLHPLLHQFTQEKLAESAERVREGHLKYYLALAEQAEPHLRGAQQQLWLDILEVEHENLRAALSHASASEAADLNLRLAGALWRFWWTRSYLGEGRAYLSEALLRDVAVQRPAARAKALAGAGAQAYGQADYPAARAFYQEELTIRREAGDDRGRARTVNNLGLVALEQGDYAAAGQWFLESLELSISLGDIQSVATARHNLGNLALYRGDYALAQALHEENLPISRALGDKRGQAFTSLNLGFAALYQESYIPALEHFNQGLDMSQQLGDKHRVALALRGLGGVAFRQGQLSLAHNYFKEGLQVAQQAGAKVVVLPLLEDLAVLHAARHPERAARLWGATSGLRQRFGIHRPPAEHDAYDKALAAARAGLADQEFRAAWSVGQGLTLEQAIRDALTNETPAPP